MGRDGGDGGDGGASGGKELDAQAGNATDPEAGPANAMGGAGAFAVHWSEDAIAENSNRRGLMGQSYVGVPPAAAEGVGAKICLRTSGKELDMTTVMHTSLLQPSIGQYRGNGEITRHHDWQGKESDRTCEHFQLVHTF